MIYNVAIEHEDARVSEQCLILQKGKLCDETYLGRAFKLLTNLTCILQTRFAKLVVYGASRRVRKHLVCMLNASELFIRKFAVTFVLLFVGMQEDCAYVSLSSLC